MMTTFLFLTLTVCWVSEWLIQPNTNH